MEGFDRLIETMVGFARTRNRSDTTVTVDMVLSEFTGRSRAGIAGEWQDILAALLRTRAYADYYLSTLGHQAMRVPAMES